MSIQEIRDNISLVSYLSSIGYTPSDESGGYLFYYSMLPGRNEKVPSFLVKKKSNRWRDPGYINEPNKWHSNIDLVMVMEGCSVIEAKRILEGGNLPKEEIVRCDYEELITLVDVDDLLDEELISYLKHIRKINVDIARLYCKEVSFLFPRSKKAPNKIFKAIGFKNDMGGYAIRNYWFKGSTNPPFYSVISGNENEVNYFEGFINFLSCLTELRVSHLKNKTVVLNSLSFFHMHLEDMRKHKNNMFIDFGDGAENYLQMIRSNGICYRDKRNNFFKGYEDWNDKLMSK